MLAILFDGGDVADEVQDEVKRSIAEAISGRRENRSEGTSDAAPIDPEDALDLLRERYARGELDDVEFERKVERLLETESVEDAETLLRTDATDREPETERS